MLLGQLALEKLQLVVGEGHHLVLTVSVVPPLPTPAPGMLAPPFKAASNQRLSAWAGYGFQ
jgi:hypothetical protein